MQIKSIEADNFKSLVDFRVELAKFSCLIGLNGVGKSTVLQFVDFLAQQVRGNIAGWLEERHWRQNEVLSKRQRQ
jgi:predicted ATPase